MEDGTVGKHCDFEGCNQKEYYAFHCRDCNKNFCGAHRHVTCELTQMNPVAPVFNDVEEVKRACGLDGGECIGEGISLCTLCHKYFCLQHRFEDEHSCAYLQQRELDAQSVKAKH